MCPSRQVWKSLSTHFGRRIRAPKDAERSLREFIAQTGQANATLQWNHGRPYAVWQDHAGPSQSIAGFIEEYLEAQADNTTKETHRHVKAYLAHFLEWSAAEKFRRLSDIRRRDMERYVAAAPGSPRTRRHYLEAIRAALNAAVRWELIEYNPAASVPAPIDRQTKTRHSLSDKDIQVIRGSWPSPEREFALLAIYTGLRLGELRHLAWSDIDLGAATIAVTAKLEFDHSPKGTRYRDGSPDVIPVVPWVVDLLAGLPRIGRFVFDDGNGRPLWSAWTWQKRIAKAAKEARMAHISPHGFRHTYCTKLAMAGVNRAVLPALARHLSPSTTDNYIHATLTDARAELAKLQEA